VTDRNLKLVFQSLDKVLIRKLKDFKDKSGYITVKELQLSLKNTCDPEEVKNVF